MFSYIVKICYSLISLGILFTFTSLPSHAQADKTSITTGITKHTKVSDTDIKKSITVATSSSTTDHSKLKQLKGPFANGPEVTKACLACHNKVGEQFKHNKHWTWKYTHPVTGQKLGKDRMINNFCISARNNTGMCAQCHAGYNKTGPNYDLSNTSNMDCLVCHDSTGAYYKKPPTRGNASFTYMCRLDKKPMNLTKIAQSVGQPTRNNCGTCHFYGGGGDNVKHGDLSSVLFDPDKSVDVHMDAKGNNFSCTTCHIGEKHNWAGSRYLMMAKEKDGSGTLGKARKTASCVSCHGEKPHPNNKIIIGMKLNDHTDRVACETCHIPSFARGGVATKTYWNWEAARKPDANTKKLEEETYVQGDGIHRHKYLPFKGAFEYGENVKPQYFWSNGIMDYTTIDTKIDPTKTVKINFMRGSAKDPDARIAPFKVMHSRQAYDTINQTLVRMKIWGTSPNDTDAFWGGYDFSKAIKAGMNKDNRPYSGKYGFIDTYSYWPINHMVATKDKALTCNECHSKNGRLQNIKGIYIPGASSFNWLDYIGLLAFFATLLAVIIHGAIRVYFRKTREQS